MCSRNILGGRVAPELPIAELSLQDVRKIFPQPFIRQLNMIYLCGNYGDPIVAKGTLGALEYFRSSNPDIRLGIYTNGSARELGFWRRLAELVDYCRFGIDGLEDTNHIYRRGTQWPKLMESVRSFIDAGGNAEWDFIVFRHNEHQVDMARKLSKEIGFTRFTAKRTARFIHPSTGENLKKIPVQDRNGNHEYDLEEPESEIFQNTAARRIDQRSKSHFRFAGYLEETPIACKAAATRSIYVSAEGEVFPCCWTGMLYRWYSRSSAAHYLSLVEASEDGRAGIDGKQRDIRDIIAGPVFQEAVPAAWKKGQIGAARLEVCARVCGSEDAYSEQFKN